MFEIDSPFTMVAIIMICVTIMSALKYRYEHEKKAPAPENDRELETLRKEVFTLTQRVKTLERLATDPEEKLKREFERL